MSAGVPENDVAGSVLIVIDSLAARVDPRCAQSLGLQRIVSQLSLSQFMADITSDSGVVVPTHLTQLTGAGGIAARFNAGSRKKRTC